MGFSFYAVKLHLLTSTKSLKFIHSTYCQPMSKQILMTCTLFLLKQRFFQLSLSVAYV